MNFFASLKNYIIKKRAEKQKVFIPLANNVLIPFCFYYCTYPHYMKWGWKHDPNPLIFVVYSEKKYTHGINLHYLNQYELSLLFKSIEDYYLKKDKISWYNYYHLFFKRTFKILLKAYRCYMSFLIKGYIVANGIYPTNKFLKIYNSNNFMLNKLQNEFNKKYNLLPPPQQNNIINKAKNYITNNILQKAKDLLQKK